MLKFFNKVKSRFSLLIYLFKKSFEILLLKGPLEFFRIMKNKQSEFLVSSQINHNYEIWLHENYPKQRDLINQKINSKKFKYRPKISIITPTYNTPKKLLKECLESVIKQSYDNWELCLTDDASTNIEVKNTILDYVKKDKRIKYYFREKNGHICKASNNCLKIVTGDYIGFLDHDDVLWPNALFKVVELINEKPYAKFIYSDEDKITENGKNHIEPFLKPDWSPDYIRSINYITHFTVIDKTLIDKVKGFRPGYEGTQDWDIFLRVINILEKEGDTHALNNKNPIQHIPNIIYSWRQSAQSTASREAVSTVKKYAYENQKKVLDDDLKRRGYKGEILPTKYLGLWRTKYDLLKKPLISIIIPTKDKYKYILNTLNSIIKKTTYKNYELIIVDNGSKDKKVFDLYSKIIKKHNKTQLIRWGGKFNYSEVCNLGVNKSKGEYILLLNNDTQIINSDWIESMLEHAQRPEVGAVGCKLLYPNGSIQHAGVILGIKNDDNILPTAGHIFKNGLDGDHSSFFQMINSIRNYSAVTAACLLVSKQKYLLVNQLDVNLKIAFNDIDFCLKLLNLGFNNVYTPFTKLYHYESISVGRLGSNYRNQKLYNKEQKIVFNKWEKLFSNDPFFKLPLYFKKAYGI
jgi:glycosyltransferase involved in cell wall biosynthesis